MARRSAVVLLALVAVAALVAGTQAALPSFNATGSPKDKAAQALGFSAGLMNGAARSVSSRIQSFTKQWTNKTAPIRDNMNTLVRAAVNTTSGVLTAGLSKVELVAVPAADKVHNVTAPLRTRINDGTVMKTILDSGLKAQTIVGNLTQPVNVLMEPVNQITDSVRFQVMLHQLRALIATGEGAADAINWLDTHYGDVEDLIHNITTPVDKLLKEHRDLAKQSVENVTTPVFNFGRKMFPELQRPNLSTIFGSIFGNLPPPPVRDMAKDPDRPTDPVWPTSFDPENKPHGAYI